MARSRGQLAAPPPQPQAAAPKPTGIVDPGSDGKDLPAEPQPSPVNPHPVGTAESYLFEIDQLEAALRLPDADPLKIGRKIDQWQKCAEIKGLDLANANIERMEPIRRFLADPELCNQQEKSLLEMQRAMDEADALSTEEEALKKKWINLIQLAILLQRRARETVWNFGIYIVRDQQTNHVIHMARQHIEIFGAWNDPVVMNSLVEMHPGSGKTTILCIQDLWEMTHDTKLRFLKMCSNLDTARKRLDVVRNYIKGRPLRALYPTVALDPTRPDNAGQFTLFRDNTGSQEPTMTAAGWTSAIQGAGFDRLDFDDLCDITVRREPTTRNNLWDNWYRVALNRRRWATGGGRIRYVCTPWHVDDVPARIQNHLRDGKMTGWRVLKFPIREDSRGDPIPLLDRPGLADDIRQQKYSDPTGYACCFKLDPRDEAIRKVKEIRLYDVTGGTDPLCPEMYRTLAGQLLAEIKAAEHWWVIDPAAGGRDNTAMIGFALLRGSGRAAMTAAKLFTSKPSENIEQICRVLETTASDRVLIEDQGAFGKTWVDFGLQYLLARLGDDFRGRVVTSGTRLRDSTTGNLQGKNQRKEQRFFAAVPYLEEGVIRLPGRWVKDTHKGAHLEVVTDPAMLQVYEQLNNYPNVLRDDAVDCLSMFVNHHITTLVRGVARMRKPVPVLKVKKYKGVLQQLYEERLAALEKEHAAFKAGNEPSERSEEGFIFEQEVA